MQRLHRVAERERGRSGPTTGSTPAELTRFVEWIGIHASPARTRPAYARLGQTAKQLTKSAPQPEGAGPVEHDESFLVGELGGGHLTVMVLTVESVEQALLSACSPPTARPGRSQHEQGLAIDFQCNGRLTTSQSNPCFRWLAANAGRYGLRNLPSEPWHWSTGER